MTTDQINYLNIGLMLISCVLAFLLPFELFLFSYAILGPLHYLTEISWLHKRHYFSPGKKDYLILGILALVITIPNIFPHFYLQFGPKDTNGNPIVTEGINNMMISMSSGNSAMIFVTFAMSALLILTKETWKRITGFILLCIVGYLFHSQKIVFFIFSVFVPTLVHVFLFTGLFILLGALRGKSVSGILSLFVFIACASSLFILFPDSINGPGPYTMRNYEATFKVFNQQLFQVFLHKNATNNMIYNSTFGIMLARFIAFAYTYHYLNWFSKTSVIKWHLVPRNALIVTFTIWVLSLALYFTDYLTGIMALYFLSYLHVVFEFPLNFRSMHDIAAEIKGRFASTNPKPGSAS